MFTSSLPPTRRLPSLFSRRLRAFRRLATYLTGGSPVHTKRLNTYEGVVLMGTRKMYTFYCLINFLPAMAVFEIRLRRANPGATIVCYLLCMYI